jgi:hypothetical protein
MHFHMEKVLPISILCHHSRENLIFFYVTIPWPSGHVTLQYPTCSKSVIMLKNYFPQKKKLLPSLYVNYLHTAKSLSNLIMVKR